MKKNFFNMVIILFLTVSSLIFSKNVIYSDTNEMTGSYTNELKLRMSKIEKNVIIIKKLFILINGHHI